MIWTFCTSWSVRRFVSSCYSLICIRPVHYLKQSYLTMSVLLGLLITLLISGVCRYDVPRICVCMCTYGYGRVCMWLRQHDASSITQKTVFDNIDMMLKEWRYLAKATRMKMKHRPHDDDDHGGSKSYIPIIISIRQTANPFSYTSSCWTSTSDHRIMIY